MAYPHFLAWKMVLSNICDVLPLNWDAVHVLGDQFRPVAAELALAYPGFDPIQLVDHLYLPRGETLHLLLSMLLDTFPILLPSDWALENLASAFPPGLDTMPIFPRSALTRPFFDPEDPLNFGPRHLSQDELAAFSRQSSFLARRMMPPPNSLSTQAYRNWKQSSLTPYSRGAPSKSLLSIERDLFQAHNRFDSDHDPSSGIC